MHVQQNMVIVAFVAAISACAAHVGGGPLSLQSTDPQYFCGRTLAKALAMLCYDDNSESKRSAAATMYDIILLPYYKRQEKQLDWPWMSPYKARSFGISSRGKRYPGVVNECCDKACSINELQTYC